MCFSHSKIQNLFSFSRKWYVGFPGGSLVKNPDNTGYMSLIPRLGGSPTQVNSNPLQYSCLGPPTERGAWWATVHGVTRVRHDLATTPPPQLMALKKFQHVSAVFHNGPYSEKWLRVFSRQLCKKSITWSHPYCSHPSSVKLASPNWISL